MNQEIQKILNDACLPPEILDYIGIDADGSAAYNLEEIKQLLGVDGSSDEDISVYEEIAELMRENAEKLSLESLLNAYSSDTLEDSDVVCESLIEELNNRMASDDEPFWKKGTALMNCYIKNPGVTDDVLIALSGWSMRSLLVFAGIIKDEEGVQL